MLEDGFSYPLRGEWVGRTIIGGILGYFSVLILPAIILYGYFVEVLRTTARGRDEAPEFDDWGEMIKDGVIGLVISIVYAIIPFGIVGIISTVFLGGGAALGGDGGGALAGLGFLTLLTDSAEWELFHRSTGTGSRCSRYLDSDDRACYNGYRITTCSIPSVLRTSCNLPNVWTRVQRCSNRISDINNIISLRLFAE